MSIHGKYNVINWKKYMGTKNPIFRSSWEKRFCNFCDIVDSVRRWGYENVIIPYMGADNKIHRYMVDFYVEIILKTGKLQKYLIEIKPNGQGPIITQSGQFLTENAPQPPKRQSPKAMRNYLYKLNQYQKNMKKWQAVQQYCKKYNIKFKVMGKDIVF